jgi:N-acetylmuramoyl-L-alanine amidase
MNRILLYLLIIISFWLPNSYSQSKNVSLNLVYPTPNEQLEVTSKPFFFIGTITPAKASLKINNQPAQVSSDGAFIGLSNVILFYKGNKTYGKFVFDITSSSGKKEIEKIFNFKKPLETSPKDTLLIDESWQVLPAENQSLAPGSFVKVEIKATPGLKAHFNIMGIKQDIPMAETQIVNNYYWSNAIFGNGFNGLNDTVKGIYWGEFRVQPAMKNAKVIISLSSDSLGTIKQIAPGRISSYENIFPEIVQTKSYDNPVIGRYAPNKGYEIFLDGGINLTVKGKIGSWYQCALSADESVFVPDSSIIKMPDGTAIPHASINTIREDDSAKFVTINFGLTQRCPYKIIEDVNSQCIQTIIYNVTSNIDWISYSPKNKFIKQITWNQLKDNVLKVNIFLKEKTFWGYSSKYQNSILNLTIRKPPIRSNNQKLPLKGKVIVLDPGHNPDTGAEGPRGTLEKDVNLEISLQLKKLLENKGAKVFLTHTSNPLPLRDRKAVVNSFNPDISISIHNNAVPEGVNPLKHNGTSTYYYFPQALPLAKLVQNNLLKKLKLNDFGIYWDNLYMTRIPESISILVEPAFIILPDQERMLLNKKFRYKISEAILNGVIKFYKDFSQ